VANKVRRPVFEGSQQVRAIWYDCAMLGEGGARRRVLADWEIDSHVYGLHNGYLLVLPRARRNDCRELAGLPLCEDGGLLTSAPLAVDERAGIAPGSAVIVQDARLFAFALTPGMRLEPWRWLALDGLVMREPLHVPLRTDAGQMPGRPETPAEVRDILDGVPTPSAARERFLEQARAAKQGENDGIPGTRQGVSAAAKSAAFGLALAALALPVGALALFGGLLGGLSGRESGGGQGRAAGSGRAAGAGNGRGHLAPERPGFMRQMLEKLVMLTKASKLMGMRQAAYLRKTMDMFEKGDLHEALRHAIPLDAKNPLTRHAFGTPRRRGSLDITGPTHGGTGIGLDAQLQEHLRQMYRRAFTNLDREGKIDEAAFVLAELLQQGAEAADYLERKERFKQAAQIAESMELQAAIAVRLWVKAGNVERAFDLARLHNAYAEAVAKLEQSNHPRAAELRLQWAEDLAARGLLTQAVEAIWPLPAQHERALEWIRLAEAADGHLGVQMLVRRLALAPDSLADSVPAIRALLRERGEEAQARRALAAESLAALKPHSLATRRLGQELLRVVLAERMAHHNALRHDVVQALLGLAEHTSLKADMPPLKLANDDVGEQVVRRGEPLCKTLEERGLLRIHDACRLPDGGYLLALGEAGVLRVRADGRHRTHFPVPASHLVLAASGEKALALVRRDSNVRVSRLDLLQRRASDWFTQPLRHWAHAYDGASWSVIAGDRLIACDAASAGLTALWQVADLPGKISGFHEENNTQAILLHGPDGMQQWRYALPARRLFQRDLFDVPQGVSFALPNTTGDTPLFLTHSELGSVMLAPAKPLDFPAIPPAASCCQGQGMLLFHWQETDSGEWRCAAVERTQGKRVLEIVLPRAQAGGVALQDGHLLAFDQNGRLIDIDLSTSITRMLVLS
jgi:hypothetical protein